jgi:cation:H+ antiporter
MGIAELLLGLLGLALLGLGGDLLVRGAVGIAGWLRVSPLFTGLVIVGFGTSMPELATSIDAAWQGSPGLAIGNVLGSNIANVLLILGITAVILPIPAEPSSFRRDAPMLALATLSCVLVVLTGELGRLSGLAFLSMLTAYLAYTYRTETRTQDASATLHALGGELLSVSTRRAGLSIALALGGLLAILAGADFLVSASLAVARSLDIPDAIIGLTLVAVGTSLPELATSVVAALKRQTDIALGNIIGSNIFNALGILGVTALVRPLEVPADIAHYDVWMLLGVTALLLVFAFSRARITRAEGAIFLLLYAAYLVFLTLRAMGGV